MNVVKTEFSEAAERHLDDVHAYLVYLTGDRATAEELTAETFARALERWHRFDPRRAGAAHLALPARALDGARPLPRRGAEAPARRSLRGPRSERDAEVFGEGLSPELERALSRLSAAEREVVALRVVLELEGEAAARVLGISATACSTRLSRALHKLEKEVSAGVAA